MITRAKQNKQQSTRFVEAIIAKNYSKANKYLKNIVERKIKKRISAQLEKPLF